MTIDTMLPIAITLHEIAEGPVSRRQAMEFSEGPGLHHELEVYTDAYNLVSTLSTAQLKPPAEKSFITHLLWLKDKLTAGVLRRLTWCDTRDMTSDGHTKGSISRDALRALAAGTRTITHPTESLELYKSKTKQATSTTTTRALMGTCLASTVLGVNTHIIMDVDRPGNPDYVYYPDNVSCLPWDNYPDFISGIDWSPREPDYSYIWVDSTTWVDTSTYVCMHDMPLP